MPQTFNVGSRSLFVTVTAWVFIVLAALASVSAAVQNATVASWAPGLPALIAGAQPLPPVTGLLMGYLPWVAGAGLVVSVVTLACAIGLLLRHEWARRSFIGLLGLAIVANLAGLWIQQEVAQSLVSAALSQATLPSPAADVFGGFVAAARSMAVVMTVLACGVMAWIMGRLMSPAVRQEFA